MELFEGVKEVVKQDYEKSIQEKVKTIQYITEQNRILQEEVNNGRSDISAMEISLNNLVSKKYKLEEELEGFKKRERILTDNFSKLNPKAEQLDTKIKELQDENNRLKTYNKELERENHELTINMHKLREENIIKAESDFQKLEKSRCEVQDLRQQVYNLKHQEEVRQLQVLQPFKSPPIPQAAPQGLTPSQPPSLGLAPSLEPTPSQQPPPQGLPQVLPLPQSLPLPQAPSLPLQ